MPNSNPDPKKSPWVQFGRFSQIAFMLPAGTVAGYLIGALLDEWLQKSWISILGLLLGTAAGIIELIRTVLREKE